MSLFVIVSENNSGVRIFGLHHDLERARHIAAQINKRIENLEDREFAEWEQRDRNGSDAEMVPDGHGRVRVLNVHRQNSERAYRFALGEMDS